MTKYVHLTKLTIANTNDSQILFYVLKDDIYWINKHDQKHDQQFEVSPSYIMTSW